MSIKLNHKEIYLLELFISVEYFGEMRDTWEKMVKHLDSCLELFMRDLKPNYRSSPLPEQPDIVWGNRILPNFRNTLQGLNDGFVLLTHGDLAGLDYAHGPENGFKGQMDYWSGWMSKEDDETYHQLLLQANTMAGNITATEGAYWKPLELSIDAEYLGPLTRPAQWPSYKINRNVSVRTGEKNQKAGIYIPDVENGCAQFLNTRFSDCSQAYVLVGIEDLRDPTTGEKYGEQPVIEKRDCTWYLVERATESDTSESMPLNEPKRRLAAGEACPETGFYFTPARTGSRTMFKQGDVMPAFDTAYGSTIWQWDRNQKV